jgi:putative membrane protein
MSGFCVFSGFMRVAEMIVIFLKGMLMGAADILPGISGGTIAFVTGIYERLIFGIKNIDFAFLKFALQGQWKKAKENFLSIDFEFFVPLSLGITCAFLLLSRVLHATLQTHPVIAYGFFFGLIAGSARVIFRSMSQHSISSTFAFVMGFIGAFIFVSLNPLEAEHSLVIIFLATIVATSAMLLPGISGAFILLFLGQYQFMLQALTELNLVVILVSSAGGFTGFITFSRVLAYLLKKHRNVTLAALTGLMLGSLRLPFGKIMETRALDPIFALVPAIVGFAIVLFLDRFANSKENEYQGSD